MPSVLEVQLTPFLCLVSLDASVQHVVHVHSRENVVSSRTLRGDVAHADGNAIGTGHCATGCGDGTARGRIVARAGALGVGAWTGHNDVGRASAGSRRAAGVGRRANLGGDFCAARCGGTGRAREAAGGVAQPIRGLQQIPAAPGGGRGCRGSKGQKENKDR